MHGSQPPLAPQISGGPAAQGYIEKKNRFIILIIFLFLRDAATRTFGIFFLASLALITIGAGIGIGVGNIAHYRKFNVPISKLFYSIFLLGYFGPYNQTNTTNDTVLTVIGSSATTHPLSLFLSVASLFLSSLVFFSFPSSLSHVFVRLFQ